MYNTILFDMDGVLIDSEPVSVQTALNYFASKGMKVRREDILNHLGAGEAEFFLAPARDNGLSVDLAEASSYFRAHYEKLLASYPHADYGSRDTVRKLRSLGFSLALCSSAPLWKVMVNIKAVGLDENDFDLVLSGEDVTRNKPDGQIYELAAAGLGKKKDECLVVEDSIAGVKAACSAGIDCLGLTTGETSHALASAGALYTASDVSILQCGSSMKEVNDMLCENNADERKLYGVNYILRRRESAGDADVDKMLKLALRARENAYTPYSKFKVGACVKSAATGRLYAGCNVENSSFGATICAERNAITTAIAAEGIIGIETLVVVSDDEPPAPPCALCLQVLAEFTSPDSLVILSSLEGKMCRYKFSELLPNPFIFPSERK